MSRGLGRVQNGCLLAIYHAERRGDEPPTTFDIAIEVYRIAADRDGYYIVSAAQHVAVKRALEGLRRQGKVIGLDKVYCRNDHEFDGRSERALCWFSERGAQKWISQQPKERAVLVKTFKAQMHAIGMQPK
jgi:hypothetical protein